MTGFIDSTPALRSRASSASFDAEVDSPSSWSDTINAAFALQLREGNSNSADRAFDNTNKERANTIRTLGGDRALALEWGAVPFWIREEWNEYERRGDVTQAPSWNYNEVAVQTFQQNRDFSRRFPDQVPDDLALFETFKAEAGELRAAETHTLETGGAIPAFLGTAAGVFMDPLIALTLPFGAGIGVGRSVGAAVARTAAIEGSIAMAVEIPIQSEVLRFKQELEAPWTFRDSAMNVMAAGLGGAAIGGTIAGGIVGTRKLLANYRTAKKSGTVDITPELEDAERALESFIEVEESNPLRFDGEESRFTTNQHQEALALATAQHQAGEAIDVSSKTAGFEPDDAVNQVLRRSEDPGELIAVDPRTIDVDADTFQFKSGTDGAGVNDALKDVKRFDQRLAGVSLIWERADGKQFIADGHQRRQLGIRAIEGGQDPEEVVLNAFLLREADGITVADARRIAAVKNIAEGSGTALDAAKLIREVGPVGDAMLPPLPPRSALVRQARGLAQLNDDNFLKVVNGVIEERYGALVGAATADAKLQSAMIDVLSRTKPANETQARSIVDQVRTIGTETRVTEDLFGEQQVTESLYLERAQILDRALREARKDQVVFGRLVSEENRIQEAGQNRLDRAANQQRIQEASYAATQISALANAKGSLSEALTEAARAVKNGKPAGPAARDFLQAARREILEGNNGRGEAGGTGPGRDAPRLEPEVTQPVRIDELAPQDRPAALRTMIARQADNSIDDIYATATAHQGALRAAAKEITDELGEEVQLVDPGIKVRAQAEDKLTRKGMKPGELTDVIRLGFMVRTPDIAARIIERLGQRFEVLDEGVTVTGMGYVDHKALVRFSDGRVGEVQLWDPEMAQAKFGRGGEIYEQVRSISADDLAADPALAAQLRAAEEASKDLYAQALADGSVEWRRVAMMRIPEDMRVRVQAALETGAGSAGASGNISSKSLLETSEPDSRISIGETRDQTSSPDATNQPSIPSSGLSRTTAGRPSQMKNLSAIDAPPRNIVRQNTDESIGTTDATRTGTVPDEEYSVVMDAYEDLLEKQGELLQVFREVDGELVPRSARNAIESLDTFEETLERIRLCNTSQRAAA